MSVGESLNFYKNAVVYYARSGDASKFSERTNAICRLVAGLTCYEKTEMQQVDLPEPFADLKDCAQKWAISDDSERAEALEKASVADLTALAKRVTPRLSSINEYLDTHSGEANSALGRLAEATAEAQIVLHQST